MIGGIIGGVFGSANFDDGSVAVVRARRQRDRPRHWWRVLAFACDRRTAVRALGLALLVVVVLGATRPALVPPVEPAHPRRSRALGQRDPGRGDPVDGLHRLQRRELGFHQRPTAWHLRAQPGLRGPALPASSWAPCSPPRREPAALLLDETEPEPRPAPEPRSDQRAVSRRDLDAAGILDPELRDVLRAMPAPQRHGTARPTTSPRSSCPLRSAPTSMRCTASRATPTRSSTSWAATTRRPRAS